jgi:hypothetical protein
MNDHQCRWRGLVVSRWDLVLRCALVAFTASAAHWLAHVGAARAGATAIAPAM